MQLYEYDVYIRFNSTTLCLYEARVRMPSCHGYTHLICLQYFSHDS